MARNRTGQVTPRKGSPGQHKNRETTHIVSRRDVSGKDPSRPPQWRQLTPAQRNERTKAFKLLRLRRDGMSWEDVQQHSDTTIRTAQYYFPKAFFHDSGGHLQVTGYDRYVERFQLPTTRPGKFEPVRARGSHQRSLCGRWLNALKAAGDSDFGPINAFPKNVFIDGYRLSTSPYVVQRIVQAIAESDKPFEELYAMAGGA